MHAVANAMSFIAQSVSLIAAFAAGGVWAAASPIFLQTGKGQVVASEVYLLDPLLGNGRGILEFEYGFTTDELPQSVNFADSFTVSLENSAGQRVYLVTSDVEGSLWAPVVPGAVPIQEASIVRQLIPFASPENALASTIAYEVRWVVPEDWVEQPLKLRFDLFDNQNALPSLGYFQNVEIIPEPTSICLLVIGTVAVGIWSRR